MIEKQNPLISIIIVNWNGRSWLETCLPALAAQSLQNFEIILVDNGSQDDSQSWLEANWPQVKVLPQATNCGFAQANNIGIREAYGRYIVTLNNDTIPEPAWLESLVTAVTDPGVGMVASQIYFWNQPSLLDSAGIEVDKVGIAWNRGYGDIVSTALQACDVFGPSAAAALYRRDMLDEIGLFDETYFAYYEDVDLAWRAQKHGWRCRYMPSAKVKHWHSATGEQTPATKAFLLGRNKVWTLLKNYDWSVQEILLYLPMMLVVDLFAVFLYTVKNRNNAAINGRFQALKSAHHITKSTKKSSGKVDLAPVSLRRYLFKQR